MGSPTSRSVASNAKTAESRSGDSAVHDVLRHHSGGGWGIRTPEGLHPTRFPSVRHRPLGESSSALAGRRPSYPAGRRSSRRGLPPMRLPLPRRRLLCRRARARRGVHRTGSHDERPRRDDREDLPSPRRLAEETLAHGRGRDRGIRPPSPCRTGRVAGPLDRDHELSHRLGRRAHARRPDARPSARGDSLPGAAMPRSIAASCTSAHAAAASPSLAARSSRRPRKARRRAGIDRARRMPKHDADRGQRVDPGDRGAALGRRRHRVRHPGDSPSPPMPWDPASG